MLFRDWRTGGLSAKGSVGKVGGSNAQGDVNRSGFPGGHFV
jgi:hypothetical protein